MLAVQMKTGAQRCSKRECRNSSMYTSVFLLLFATCHRLSAIRHPPQGSQTLAQDVEPAVRVVEGPEPDRTRLVAPAYEGRSGDNVSQEEAQPCAPA
jgi:hypothetical protein